MDNKNMYGGYTVTSSVRLSVFQTLENVKVQVRYTDFGSVPAQSKTGNKIIDPIFGELCLIIAEIALIDPTVTVKINGTDIDIWIVKEVYRSLTHEHLQLVYDNFNEVTHKIYNKKAYLRTALYNAAFEIDSHFTNLVRQDFPNSLL